MRAIFAFTLALALGAATGQTAWAEMPNSGQSAYTNVYSAELKTIPLTKDRAIMTYEGLGVLISDSGKGPFHNMSTHSVGIVYMEKGVSRLVGYMIATDPDGDRVFVETREGDVSMKPGPKQGRGKYIGGTGKFEGITGTLQYQRWYVRPAVKGTAQGISKTKATWSLSGAGR